MVTTTIGVTGVSGGEPAFADTAPVDPSLPETVSAAALPTVQVNGVVWAQVIVGNRVYATGQFTRARPPGAAAGTNETVRSNILAYDLTTGQLITSWNPSLNAQGLAIAASPDGSRIYVGGDFDQVSGQWRSRIAALDAQTGAVLPFNPGANTTVRTIVAHGNTVYYGGFFTSVGNSSIGFQARSRMAAANATTGAIMQWAPSADLAVFAMVVHPPSNRVIVGGQFNTLNGQQNWGMGAVDATTGAVLSWEANRVIQNHNQDAAISGLTTDGEKIFGIGWAFFGGGATANFEGVFSADPYTGALDWVDGGRGDNYDVVVTGDVVYGVGHPHDWGMLDWNPQYPDPWRFQRAWAVSKHRSPTLTNAFGTPDTWQPFRGRPASQPLHWLPTLTGGTYTGQGQAAWDIDSNGDYVVLGGEFPRVNGVNQQGLVRFAKRTISPSVDPIQVASELTPTLTALGSGTVRVAWTAAWDRDNERLKVEVLRGASTGSSTVLTTFNTSTTWWNRPPLGFVDTTAPPGTSQTYRIRVSDPFGNTAVGPAASITVPSGSPPSTPYRNAVMADRPDWHWRLGETSGTTARDRAGSNDAVLSSGNQRNVAGALLNESDTATSFPGSSSTSTVQGVSSYWQPAPQQFSMETWIRTNTTSGGKILSFGNSNTGRSSVDGNDRVLYMNNSGQIYFGVRPDMGNRITINSPGTYRDNAWHHVVASLGADGMKLYVDGNLVASNPNVTKGQVYRGYWRLGGDRMTNWPSTPAREAITATIDEAAIYPYPLPLGRVRAHYLASGRNASFPNTPPTADFTTTANQLAISFDGRSSVDHDGTIASYSWSFGDGTSGSGATPQHTYSSPGAYTVRLTVTDDDGASDTVTKTIIATIPGFNIPPTAAFTTDVVFHTATFTSQSTDVDGTVASHAWSFGDGTNGTGATAQHTYASAGVYQVTLTVTDNGGKTHSLQQPVVITDGIASDTFQRTAANGWGNADNGGAWSASGTASAFSVSGGEGRMAGAAGSTRAAYLPAVRHDDIDISVQVALDRAATGGGAYVSIIGRRVSNNNDYRLKLRYQAGGSVAAYLVRTLNGTETTLASGTIPGISATAGTELLARFQVTGNNPTNLRAKVWRVGAAQPTAWQLTGTDTTTPTVLRSPGDLGLMLYVSSSWTGTAPVLLVDDLNAVPEGADPPPPTNFPPTAAFTFTTNQLTASFDASTSNDIDGSIVSWAWSFGDGTSGSGETAQRTYGAPGTYTVRLTVTDDDGASTTTERSVTVSLPPPPAPPIAAFTFTTNQQTASFDASTSSDPDGGGIVSYAWDFGDGTSGTGVTAQRTYGAPGTYTVRLTVTDDEGSTSSTQQSVTVSAAPVERVLDTFSRTVSNGLGTAEIGGVWTLGGPATNFSVSGGVARIVGTAGAGRAGYLQSVSEQNVDLTADVSLSTASSANGAYVSLIGRRVSNGTDYRLKLRYMSDGTVAAYLVRTLAGTETTLSWTTVPGLVVSPGQVLSTRLQVTGTTTTTLRAKVWRAGTAEPAGWTVTATDQVTPTELRAPGGVGVYFYLSGSWAGALPTLSLDNLRVVPPAP